MKVEGQCHCGQVSFEAEIDPNMVRICHCTDCQTLSGSAYRVSVQAPAAGFRLLTGQPKVYIKTAESGSERAQGFCGNCGTAIYSAAPRDPPTYMLRVGTLKQRSQLQPSRQIWSRSAQPWAKDLWHVQEIERQ